MARPSKTPVGRREKALATRRSMLRAAQKLFRERGFVGTTMQAIANEAGVAVQTVYFTFNNKVAILHEAFGAAVIGVDRWDPRIVAEVEKDTKRAFADYHAWFPAFEAAATPAEALAIFVDATLELLPRVAPLVPAMREAATADAVARKQLEIAERRRVEGYELVAEVLAKRGGLKRGVGTRRATDILLALVSADVFRSLTARGWTTSACRRFYLDVLGSELLR
jgi:AcrR family transcriptional regulator